ncbi:Chitin synthase, class 3, partial [Nowakowskiella sp. JEL0078]
MSLNASGTDSQSGAISSVNTSVDRRSDTRTDEATNVSPDVDKNQFVYPPYPPQAPGEHRQFTMVRNALNRTIYRGALGSRPDKQMFQSSVPSNLDKLSKRKKRKNSKTANDDRWWLNLSNFLTCCFPNILLKLCIKKDDVVLQAFREKLALCAIILAFMLVVGFIMFGFNQLICLTPGTSYTISQVAGNSNLNGNIFAIHGYVYEFNPSKHPQLPASTFISGQQTSIEISKLIWGNIIDVGFLFQKPLKYHACNVFANYKQLPCDLPYWNTTI